MTKKILLWLLATVSLATASIAEAQQAGKIFRIGVLAMKFEFIINLKAAKQIGHMIPYELLARATKIIRCGERREAPPEADQPPAETGNSQKPEDIILCGHSAESRGPRTVFGIRREDITW